MAPVLLAVELSQLRPTEPFGSTGASISDRNCVTYSMSSKIKISIHEIAELQMKRPDLLASGHAFSHPRLGTLEWKEEDIFKTRFKLIDKSKTVLARFDKSSSPEDSVLFRKKRKSYAFLVFIDADPELLDWIVVTGLGAVEYRLHSNANWDKLLMKAYKEGDDDDGDDFLDLLLG